MKVFTCKRQLHKNGCTNRALEEVAQTLKALTPKFIGSAQESAAVWVALNVSKRANVF